MFSAPIIFSLIFVLILALLVKGAHHRSVIAMFGALLTIACGLGLGIFNMDDVAVSISSDIDTILLIIGSMILCESLGRAGLFQYIGLNMVINIGRSIRWLAAVMLMLTVILAAFLENITAMIIIGALTLSLERRLEIDLSEMICYEAIFTNIGGQMLLISSIPNLVVADGFDIGFSRFAIIGAPLSLILMAVSIYMVAERLKYIPLKKNLDIDPWSAVEDRDVFYRSVVIFAIVMILFVLNDIIHIGMGLIAISGAVAMLILSGEDPESIFRSIDWGTIFFLISFFVIVGGLERSGSLMIFAESLSRLFQIEPALAYVFNLLICGLASAFVDNVPITITLIPVTKYIAADLGLDTEILAWSLIFGANLGGNFTPIGSPSNIIAIGMLKRKGKNINFLEWFRKYAIFPCIHLFLAGLYMGLLVVT